MINFPISSTDVRLLLPEIIELETEYFEQAKEMSDKVTGEMHQWQSYLNALALLSFKEWLRERTSQQPANQNTKMIEGENNLLFGGFKFCLIATEHLLDEVVNIPLDALEQPEQAAHFYVLVEVLEEEEQAIIRGFLRHDLLVNYIRQVNLQFLSNGSYQLPLSLFDAEPNHLLFYCRYLEPTAIPLPVTSVETKTSEKLLESLKETRTKLSQWLQGVFDETWQAIDAFVIPEANLAFSTRNTSLGAKRGKLIDLGMQLSSQTFALLVTVIEETEEKLNISIQLHPTGGERYLPPNLKLTLLSKAGKTLQEVTSRSGDNYIQLLSFKGERGKRFSIQLSLDDVTFTEDFEF